MVEEENKLNRLKELIIRETDDSMMTDWETLIAHLRDKRDQTVAEYKQKTAEIVGKKLVFDVLGELRKDEDEKIIEGLKDDRVARTLHKLTGKYSRFILTENQLSVADEMNTFPLEELSTGAREQALLSLRIGFSSRLFNDELFLIFDDAFQYSDWDRREYLTDMTVELAQSGWQIFYFTMDDHIRDLLVKKGKSLKDQFILQTLN